MDIERFGKLTRNNQVSPEIHSTSQSNIVSETVEYTPRPTIQMFADMFSDRNSIQQIQSPSYTRPPLPPRLMDASINGVQSNSTFSLYGEKDNSYNEDINSVVRPSKYVLTRVYKKDKSRYSDRNKLKLKFILLGDSGTGKTTFTRSLHEEYKPFSSPTSSTIGVEFDYLCYIDPKSDDLIQANIWDTAGQERFRSITRSYYRDGCCCILFFDVTKRETFNNIDSWMRDMYNNIQGRAMLFILVGNKCDLVTQRQILYEEAREKADKYDMVYLESDSITPKLSWRTMNSIVEYVYENKEIPSQGVTFVHTYDISHYINLERKGSKRIIGGYTKHSGRSCCSIQ